jgi:hypothetical protein
LGTPVQDLYYDGFQYKIGTVIYRRARGESLGGASTSKAIAFAIAW